LITGGGLVMAAALVWAASHFGLLQRGKDLVGLS
jgi:hypothetical protein